MPSKCNQDSTHIVQQRRCQFNLGGGGLLKQGSAKYQDKLTHRVTGTGGVAYLMPIRPDIQCSDSKLRRHVHTSYYNYQGLSAMVHAANLINHLSTTSTFCY